MKFRFYLKLTVIFFLILALLVPKSFLMDLINERNSWRDQAYQGIEQSWPGAQTLAGPVLTVPYKVTWMVKEKVIGEKKQVKEVIKEQCIDDVLYLIPKKLDIKSKLETSMRYRSIYEVPVYTNNLAVTGEFSNQALLDVLAEYKDKKITWGKPQISVLVNDQRGIAAPPSLMWGADKIAFLPGSDLPGTSVGMHTVIPAIAVDSLKPMPFSFALELRGMRGMNFALLSEDSKVELSANWPHPSFTGELLAETRDITETGFTAQWRASSFSFNVTGALDQCRRGECLSLTQRAVGFDLVTPVDVYQQSERSIKYAELFILLSFIALILFELLKRCPIHPIQYLLVGFALLVFYLLLVSLSEHILFAYAYLAATVASSGLLTVYFGGILKSRKSGLVLGSSLAGLYGLLYMILQSEENALLMGSLLIFAVLAGLMFSTRHFDWYALTSGQETPAKGVDHEA